MTHMERLRAAQAHIKAGEYDKALALYDDPESLASERRVVVGYIEKAKAAAIRHRGNSEDS